MAKEFTCITRKIEVHLHRHGDDEEAIQRYKNEFRIWNEINDNLYKAANRVVSHCFFNDAYEYRMKIHSPRLQQIERDLKYSKRNKLTDDDIKQLKAERTCCLRILPNNVVLFCVEAQSREQIQSKIQPIKLSAMNFLIPFLQIY